MEQVKRRVELLKQILKDNGFLKNKIGQEIKIDFKVLIKSKTNIIENICSKEIEKADIFMTNWLKEIDNASFSKVIGVLLSLKSRDSLDGISEFIINSHNPIKFDYSKKYRIKKIEVFITEV